MRPSAIMPVHAADNGSATHQRACRRVNHRSTDATANGSVSAADARTGTSCQRTPSNSNAIAVGTTTNAPAIAAGRRAEGGNQRATTSATEPDCRTISSGDISSATTVRVVRGLDRKTVDRALCSAYHGRRVSPHRARAVSSGRYARCRSDASAHRALPVPVSIEIGLGYAVTCSSDPSTSHASSPSGAPVGVLVGDKRPLLELPLSRL